MSRTITQARYANGASNSRSTPLALHQFVLDELTNIDELDWTRGCIDAVSVRSKRGAS